VLFVSIDEDGNLVDVRLSKKRDLEAAKAFFAQAHELVEDIPNGCNGWTYHTQATAEELGTEVEHEVRGCLGNPIEQSHRGIKQRYYPTLGFGAFESAKRFCQAHDEVKCFCDRARMTQFISLSERRERFLTRGCNRYFKLLNKRRERGKLC